MIDTDWWVVKWTRVKVLQEYLSGPYDNEDDARYEAIKQVEAKPEGTVIGLCTSSKASKDRSIS